MKKFISFIGIVCLVIVTILNVLYTANLDRNEHITIENNTFIYVLGIILLGISIFFITNIIDKKVCIKETEIAKKKRKIYLIVVITIFAIINILWVLTVRPPIVWDQLYVCNLAQIFYNNNLEGLLQNMTYAEIPLSQYIQSYHQQISLAFIFSIFFRIIHFDGISILRALNVIGNIAIFIAIYKIVQQLSKNYNVNKTRMSFLILTFVSLPMLATFVYGDIPSLALCLFSTYFMMKYTETKKFRYPLCASLFTMIAYMMRMNCLIFIIATVMYLLFDLFKNITHRIYKENVIKVSIIAMYICISIIPAPLIQNYYLDKYDMDRNAEYPTISYLLMAMEESWRGNGWYNENRGNYALRNIGKAKIEYVDEIKSRLQYFSENKGDAIDFYVKKLASMWTENTYSVIKVNTNMSIKNNPIQNITNSLTFYQKTLLLLMCTCVCIFLVQNRKNISLDIIFLLTIFIGGFTFHILWEAKSRYIIPYIVVLIPIASMEIKKIGLKEKIINIYYKIKKKI